MTLDRDGEAAYTAKLKEAMDHLNHHIHDEEDTFWPQAGHKRRGGSSARLPGSCKERRGACGKGKGQRASVGDPQPEPSVRTTGATR